MSFVSMMDTAGILMRCGCLVIATLTSFAALPAYAQPTLLHRTDVFGPGMAGFDAFESPALLAVPDDGTLAFAIAARAGHGTRALVCSRSIDNGMSWSAPAVIGGAVEGSVRDFAVVTDRNAGRVIALYAITADANGPVQFVMRSSPDGGIRWSEARDISADLTMDRGADVRLGGAAGLQMHHGRLLVGATRLTDGQFDACAVYSDDGGGTWRLGSAAYYPKAAGHSLALMSRNFLVMHGNRADSGASVFYASSDGGLTWGVWMPGMATQGRPAIAAVSAPGSGAAMFLWCGADAANNDRLTLRVDTDLTLGFANRYLLDDHGAVACSLVSLGDGAVGVLWQGTKPGSGTVFARIELTGLDS